MQQNSSFKKLIQISEEPLPPIHVPIILGSDCYIITQQDIRKTEESRFLSLSKLMSNGDLKLVNFTTPESLIELLKLKKLFDSHSTIYPGTMNNQNLLDFIGFIYSQTNGCLEAQQMQQQNFPSSQQHLQCPPSPHPMEISSNSCPVTQQLASIEQQLEWDKCNNTSAPFPMTYSQGTSSTEILGSISNCKTQKNTQTCCNCCCCCQTCRSRNNTKTVTFSRGTYTSDYNKKCKTQTEKLGAREQLKQNKLRYEFAYTS